MKQQFHLKSSVNITGYHRNLKMLIVLRDSIDPRHQGHFKELVREK